jgi:protein-disulfide isomerase/uncharacterized membrane protein
MTHHFRGFPRIHFSWFYVLLVTSILALINSAYLVYHHHIVTILRPVEKSFCSINSLIDCDAVAASAYATTFGIPNASMAVFAYVFMTVLFVTGLYSSRENLRKYLAVSYWMLLTMLVFSLYAFFVSIFILKTICLMCCVLYLCILLMTISAKKALNTPMNSLLKEAWAFFFPLAWSGSKKIHYSLFAGIAIVSALAALALDGHSRNHYRKVYAENRLHEAAMQGALGANREDLLNEQFRRLPQHSFDLSDSPCLGPADAPVVLVEFSDFQCPACAYKAKFFSDLVAEFPGQVKLYYKFYPLDNSCNPQIDRAFHPVACMAARYAYCAYKIGKFWPVHDIFYENHRRLDSALFKQLLKASRVPQNVIDECSGKDAVRAVDRDIKEANSLKIDYTPTIFLNGRKVSDIIRNVEEARDLIRRVLHEGQ